MIARSDLISLPVPVLAPAEEDIDALIPFDQNFLLLRLEAFRLYSTLYRIDPAEPEWRTRL
jgi:hypothetical protein